MSQVTSSQVPSGSGLSVREGINAVLAALMSMNSGASSPANPTAGQVWFDTAANNLKVRNAANTAWVPLAEMIGALEYARASDLTNTQMTQVRSNLGLGAVATDSVVPLARGGTGASTVENARIALSVDRLQPSVGETRITSSDAARYLYLLGSGNWGVVNMGALSVANGGTGGTSEQGARNNLNTPLWPQGGNFVTISSGATGTFTLPSGGTWAWFCISDTGNTVWGAHSGVNAGGYTIDVGASNRFLRGFAWRISN